MAFLGMRPLALRIGNSAPVICFKVSANSLMAFVSAAIASGCEIITKVDFPFSARLISPRAQKLRNVITKNGKRALVFMCRGLDAGQKKCFILSPLQFVSSSACNEKDIVGRNLRWDRNESW